MEKGVIGKNNRQRRTLRNYISAHTKRLVAHGKTILDGCVSVHQHALWVMQMPGVSRNGKKGNSGCEVSLFSIFDALSLKHYGIVQQK